MIPLLFFAFVAGILTILSPCVLVVIPLVAGTSAGGGRRRLAGFVAAFSGVFVIVTVLIASSLAAAGFTTDGLRFASAILLGTLGATIAIPTVGRWFEARTAMTPQIGIRLMADAGDTDGFTRGVVVGAASGLIWAPCVGPIMAAVIAAAVTAGPTTGAVAVGLAYAVGAAIPLALIGIAGRRAVTAFGGPARRANAVQAFGALTIVAAVLVATGTDLRVEAAVADALPAEFSGHITAIEDIPAVQEELSLLDGSNAAGSGAGSLLPPVADALPGSVTLDDFGPAPELTGITAWINSEPLSLASLRGKVVLVHFWTFGCINCIHVQPYVKAWYDRYAAAGLVVIGVHTPELSFERNLDNVRSAVADDGVTFPVAFDPSFATWNAYRNQYWPAFYFVDRGGQIRHVHVGEGDYDGSETVLRELLAEPG